MKRIHLIPLASAILLALLVSAHGYLVNDSPYPQLGVERFLFQQSKPLADWKSVPFDSVLDVASWPGSENFIILTPNAIYLFNPSSGTSTLLQRSFTTFSKLSVLVDTPPKVVIADELNLRVCTLNLSPIQLSCQSTPLPSPARVTNLKFGTFNDIYFSSDLLYSLDLQHGLFGNFGDQEGLENITSIDYHAPSQSLAVGTPKKLLRLGNLPHRFGPDWRFYHVGGLIDSAISSISYDQSGDLFIGNKDALNILSSDLTFSRLGGAPGALPYGNITRVATSSYGAVWMGTDRGVIRYFNGTWNYFNGPRYMTDMAFGPGNQVKALAVGQSNGFDSVLVVTGTGLSWIHYSLYTLQGKADYFQSIVKPYHDRFGLTSAAALRNWGDISSFQPRSSENDGLWTSMYLASQALRYAATGDPAAKSEADIALTGLELLNNVTGVAGLFARSVLKQDTLPSGRMPWRFSSTMPGWVWQGDTSSDEVTGHMFAYTLYHQLVAKTPQEKMRAAKLLTDCVAYITKNNFYLLDVNGQRTTWGVWNPDYLNNNDQWFDQRGVNSLQILTWLTAAETLATANGLSSQIFTSARYQLISRYQYDLNILNTKIETPSDDNYSDDQLIFLPYYTYVLGKNAASTNLDYPCFTGMDRTFDIVKTTKSPLWAFIYGAAQQSRKSPAVLKTADVTNAMATLHDWPLSWINWPVDNTQRLDLILSRYHNIASSDQVDMLTLLPYNEIDLFRWNTDPFRFEATGSGFALTEPTAFLLPYWLGRYHQIIAPSTSSR